MRERLASGDAAAGAAGRDLQAARVADDAVAEHPGRLPRWARAVRPAALATEIEHFIPLFPD